MTEKKLQAIRHYLSEENYCEPDPSISIDDYEDKIFDKVEVETFGASFDDRQFIILDEQELENLKNTKQDKFYILEI